MKLKKINGTEGFKVARAWGYPRPITPDEKHLGVWVAYKDVAVGWLEPTEFVNAFGVHYAVRPDWRGRYWPVHHCLEEMAEMAADEAGQLKGLLVVVATEQVKPYLERLGFEQDPNSRLWCYRFGTLDPPTEVQDG